MALFSECTVKYVSKLLDTADIVRDAIFQVRLSFEHLHLTRSDEIYLLVD